MTYDLIIIGAGPAGITASVYAARKKMNFIVITKDIGGQTVWSSDVENYTGYQFITGADLTDKFEKHMRQYAVQLKENEEALKLRSEKDKHFVETDKEEYSAKTVIVASGKKSRELGVPGESEFKNKGLTYCATCDGPLFAGKEVAVIGGGNAGLDAAVQLSSIASKVYIIERGLELTGDEIVQEKISKNKKVEVILRAKVTKVIGSKMVNGLEIESDGKKKTIPLQGVFVEIGLVPNSEFAKELNKNEKGEIKIDLYNKTNVSGVFAAGDVTDVPEKQIIIAAGEGSKATLSAFKYLTRL